MKLTAVQGWEAPDDPLVARFDIEVPNYGSTAGKRLLIPSYLFQTVQNDAFKHAERKYPVYFAYAFTEFDTTNITLPGGYNLESAPQAEEAALPYAKYQNVTQFDGKQLSTQRKLFFNGIYFDLNKYTELKGFFGKVLSGDEQQAVLHSGGTSAQKTN